MDTVTGWIKCPRCGQEPLARVFDEHWEWCQNHPLPAEREKEHAKEYKATIIVDGKRYNYRCACGVDGKVWYSERNAVWQAIIIHRRYPKLSS